MLSVTKSEKIDILPANSQLKLKARPLSLDERTELLARAENALHKLRTQFIDWMHEETDNLAHAYAAWQGEDPNAQNWEKRLALFRVAHDIKGQAATLGYPIVGQIATSLCYLLRPDAVPDNVAMTLAERHVSAIKAAVREEARGDDHPVAGILAAELENLVTQTIEEQVRPAHAEPNGDTAE